MALTHVNQLADPAVQAERRNRQATTIVQLRTRIAQMEKRILDPPATDLGTPDVHLLRMELRNINAHVGTLAWDIVSSAPLHRRSELRGSVAIISDRLLASKARTDEANDHRGIWKIAAKHLELARYELEMAYSRLGALFVVAGRD